MSNWQEDLLKINLKKEVTNDSSTIGNSGSSRIHRIQDIKEKGNTINNVKEKEVKRMIGLEGALSDIDDIITKGTYNDRDAKKVVEVKTDIEKYGAIAKVFIKFLSTIRSNQLLTEEEKKEIQKKRKERDSKKENNK